MKSILRHLAIIALCWTSLVHGSRAEEPKTLEEALLNYSWSWNDLGSDGKGHWKTVLRFEEDHHIQKQPSWAWSITGQLSATIKLPGNSGKAFAELTFSDDLTEYQGIGRNFFKNGANVKISGRRAEYLPAARTKSTDRKPEQPHIRTLSDESVNITAWITSPLEVSVPEQIWENLNFLKEALKDEAAQKPAANAKAYTMANFLCAQMLRYLEERDQFTARAGGAAVLHQKSNLTQQNRNHLTWPQFALERDERVERKQNARNAPKFMNGNHLVEWNTRKTIVRRQMESAYADFREALRQSPAAK